MRRVFLGIGDKAGEAFITEGLLGVTCSNPPPEVNISTLYMKTYCQACKQEGYIAPRGPRHKGTGPNGQPWALSGDISICGCSPPPVFYAERNMAMVFSAEESMGFIKQRANTTTSGTAQRNYDEQFTLHDANGRVLRDTYYTVRLPSGELQHGVTDSLGRTARYQTDGARTLALYLGHREV